MSGEALTSAQDPSVSPVTAIEDCVLGWARTVPARTPAQLRQLQFHWGKPPPAADPSTRIFTVHRRYQRLAIYRVISMPNRMSIARGVSQRMVELLLLCRITIPKYPRRRKGRGFADETA